MDRIEFLQSINYMEGTSIHDILLSFFDQYMLLYNLVEDVQNVSIIDTDGFNIIFQVTYSNTDTANRVVKRIMENPAIHIYESIYAINVEVVNNTTINISIMK